MLFNVPGLTCISSTERQVFYHMRPGVRQEWVVYLYFSLRNLKLHTLLCICLINPMILANFYFLLIYLQSWYCVLSAYFSTVPVECYM